MEKIRKLRLLLVLLLLGWTGRALAVEISGNVTGRTISTNTTWDVTGNISLKGQIVIANGATLTVRPKGGNWVIKRSGFGGALFSVAEGTGDDGGGKLVITWDSEHLYRLTIDGGAKYANDDARDHANTGSSYEGVIIRADGNANIYHCNIQNGYHSSGWGAVYCNNSGKYRRTLNMTDVTIRAVRCQEGAGVGFNQEDKHTANLTRVRIFYCFATHTGTSKAGIIRTYGSTSIILTVDSCNLHHNKVNDRGGGIYWNSNGDDDAKITIKGKTQIHHNHSVTRAGAIYTTSIMDIQSAYIYENTSPIGAGIYMDTYDGRRDNYNGIGFDLTIKDGVYIYNNTATEAGGGCYLNIMKSDDVGFDNAGRPMSPEFWFRMQGGEIYGNKAPRGAGVAIEDKAAKRHKNQRSDLNSGGNNPAYNKWSLEYVRNVSITGGKIYDNITTGTDTKGGGILVRKYIDPTIQSGSAGYNYTQAQGAGTMTVTGTGGKVYNNSSTSGNGGGLYIVNEVPTTAPHNAVCTVTMGGTIEIYDNNCYGNGAGVYVTSGNFNMTGGTVGKSGHPNTAHNGNGGGIAVDGGIVTVSGGSIMYNLADNNGGGFYVNTTGTSTTTIKGGAVVGYNTAINGGGAYINQGTLAIQDAATNIHHNNASTKGGGVYLNNGTVTIANSQILSNTATSDGGGLFAGGGNVTVTGAAHINSNQARDGGGGYVNNGTLTLTGSGAGIQVNSNKAVYTNTSYGNGGGFFVGGGNVSISGVCQVDSNSATDDGGGFYTTGGTVTISGTNAVISNNSAVYWGGGVRAGGSVTLTGGQIYGNHANARGGGVYVHGGNFTMSNGTIGGTTANGNYTSNSGSSGGGVYMSAGTATISGGTLSGNYTNAGYGGGVYMDGGTCTLSNGATIGGASASYANSSKYGGGIYSAGGTITVKGGKIQRNTASTAGGGIYTNGADGIVNMEKQTSKAEALSYIEYNTAQEGGGIYANRGVVNFSDGYIQYNYASEAGGGIYVNDNGDDDYGTLYLKGSANLRRNHVPEGHNGGGVYLKGKVVVGEQTSTLGVIKAQENFAGDEYIYTWNDTGHPETDSIDQVTANNRNNIYLPRPEDTLVLTTHRDVITVIENGISLESRVGFSVPRNYVPVIYCAPSSTSYAYLDQFSTGHDYQYMIFDDTRHYVAVHYADRPTIFNPDHVYLYGFWSNVVTGHSNLECDITAADFEGQDPIEIHDACELAFFISWVNGLNGLDRHAGANAKLMADIDMSKYGWVPIGDLTGGYSGTFDGQGHTITGISSLLYREYMDYGFFGRLNGGTVKDLFVMDAHYVFEDKDCLVIGGLVGEINNGSTVSNCEASSKITASNTNTVIGGLVGRMNAGTVHSAIGISDMKGRLMGGLVGEQLGGNLYNSFSNTRFSTLDGDVDTEMTVCSGTSTSQYVPVDGEGGNDGSWASVSGFILPASQINGLRGRELTSMTFYLDTPASTSWGSARFKVYLQEVSQSDFGGVYVDMAAISATDAVYEGSLDATGETMSIAFDTPYTYGGGNLLVVIAQTANGTHSPAVFSGMATSSEYGNSFCGDYSLSSYLMSALVYDFIPRTSFDFNFTPYMGGLAAVNRDTVENCYARLRGSVPKGNFGILVGDNTDGVVNYCYAPAGMTDYKAAGANPTGHGNYGDSFLPYLYGHRDTQVSLANSSNSYVPTDADADKQMMNVLNRWVDTINSKQSAINYTKWGRPWHENDDVKPLNDDYPILRMPMCEAVGAKKGDPYLYYNPIDSLLVRYTEADEAIWLYNNPGDVVRGDNSGSDAKLYIAEEVALINLNELKAYVGITLDNSAGGNGAGPTYGEVLGINGDGTDWHLFSTSLSNAPTGINYSDGRPYEFSYGHPTGMPYYLFYEKGDARNGYFPSHRFGKSYPSSDLTIEEGNYYQEWDFYCYSEPCYHWINFKRNSNSHRRYDTEQHEPIAYDNEPTLGLGKGYFFATREETFLQCQGNLNTDEVIIGLTYTPNVPRHGYNLIGNPYQAYLDFNAFAEANQGDVDGIWDAFETPSYTILDEDCGGYVTFAYDESNNPDAAGRFIHPHQGFFVRTLSGYSNAYFEPEMRNASDTVTSVFRNNNHIDYPLVNLFVSEANGVRDMVTVELGRPEQGGAAMLAGLRAGKGRIWCHYNDKDYTVAYTEPGITEAAIRFETFEDTEYTMRWNTYNGDFNYLHLIDNQTGADVDCLSASEYRFSASTSDYKSRFRLVFGYTGLEEDIDAEANQNFAFMMGDELVVTGEGVLQVFDMTGRQVASQELHGVQTMVSLPNAANGVYVMRLTDGKQSRVQKMVISK